MSLPAYWGNQGEWNREAKRQLDPIIAQGVMTVTSYSGTLPLDPRLVALVDASAGPVTITLPTAKDALRREIVIKKIDASANAVTIDGNGSETIDGAATQTLTAQWEAVRPVSNGFAWFLV